MAKKNSKPKKVNRVKDIPTGVKIFSILYYISGVLLILGAILSFFGGSIISSILGLNQGVVAITTLVFVFIGIFFILMAVLSFFIARGLRKGQDWARILIIVFSALGILSSIVSLFGGNWASLFGILVDGFVLWYFLLKENVKKFFLR